MATNAISDGKTAPLAKLPEGIESDSIIDPNVHHVLECFTLEGLGAAYAENGWSVMEEVKTLAEVARDPEVDPRVRLEYLREIRRYRTDIMALRGARKVTATTDGTKTIVRHEGVVLGPENENALLEQASRARHILNAGQKLGVEANHEPDDTGETIEGSFVRSVDPEGAVQFDPLATARNVTGVDGEIIDFGDDDEAEDSD